MEITKHMYSMEMTKHKHLTIWQWMEITKHKHLSVCHSMEMTKHKHLSIWQ